MKDIRLGFARDFWLRYGYITSAERRPCFVAIADELEGETIDIWLHVTPRGHAKLLALDFETSHWRWIPSA